MSDLNSYEKGLANDLAKAQVRIKELEANLRDMSLDCLAALGQAGEAYQAQLVAEDKLAKAIRALEFIGCEENAEGKFARTTLAELEPKS
jgi:hypothetical protein